MLWLHFDVLANVLCQIRGTKTLRLYSPSDAMHLEFPPGGSSSNIDVFTHDHPPLALTHPHEVLLSPGDVLFIPPMWSHTARPTAGMSVAVNVFFRNLEQKHYAIGRDVYGNRDLQAYESGRKDIEKMAKAFEGMPTEIAKFYLERLAAELKGKAQGFGSE
ncbi:Clavaminate synthase-like protein [Mytilinidion resinicola]|uniref:Clavaminate synthase-like protein n=1 Tax=Mytilinidion resinicola TaxID=574789 RepID=A0A6A6Z583_9PEZI|nr:Clavaminate synthase-like protein [Mytilinidion resinicola]KAF2816246.1 Clavaminate synthase-like protein [Mytilinidion resinicola]